EHGIDPDVDVQIRAVPPPEMVANLRADNIDGFLGPDPMNQRAVYDGAGFIHILTKDIWEGHPCCAFAASKEFITSMPNTYSALLKSIIEATAFAHKAENRKQIAEAIAPANYLNQPQIVLEQILTGTFADGLGNIVTQPNRVGAAVVLISLVAAFIVIWHIATRSTAAVGAMSPEYAKLMGATATQGKSAMPGPLDVGAKLWEHVRRPFYDNGPNDKGLGIQL